MENIMKIKYLITSLALALLLSVSCSDSTPPETPKPRNTMIMYVLADSNLKPHLDGNIADILSIVPTALPANGRIFIYYDSKTEVTLYEVVVQDGKAEKTECKSYPQRNSLDPTNMAEVINDVKAINDSRTDEISIGETYGIVFSSHATGWFPAEISPNVPMGQTLPEHDFRKPDGALMTRFFGDDGGARMSMPGLVQGLSPIHFDYILFDACFMSSIEALYDMRGSADYVIASPAEIMAAGFPFKKTIPILFDNKRELPDRLTGTAQAFMDYYNNEASTQSGAIVVVRTSALDNIASAVRDVYAKNSCEIDADYIQPLESMHTHAFFDLANYILARSVSPADYYAFIEALDNALLYEGHTSQIYSAYGGFFDASYVSGISTYIPRDQFPVTRNAWLETAWAKYVVPAEQEP